MSVPPESGGYYGYKFPSNDVEATLEVTGTQRRCTVKGCQRPIEPESPNKMCESCRGKHRIYASTKRARRKLEKAAVSGQTVVPVEQIPGSAAWMPRPEDQRPEHGLSDGPYAPGTIDPRLFRSNPSTSSELAGALTLPPTISRPAEVSPVRDSPPPAKKPRTGKEKSPDTLSPVPAPNADTLPPRFCSVKGCRTVIDGSYPYKMCEPCRDRYRNYGITKRRKWKAERVAFEQELDNLRDVEDERRRGLGLAPLSDSPDELFEWEQSIVDEKISMPENIEALVSAYSSLSPQTLLTAMPDQSLALSTASIQSLGQTSSDKPVPNLPPHMCTVSHCHKILPGSYLFKRCEQHRLQNRHHSQLKRVREKEVKSVGPPEGSVGETFEIGRDSQSVQEDADADDDDADEQPAIDYEAEYIREKERAEKRHRTWSCTAPNCHNLIPPGTRWRMCDPCRINRKALQAQRRADVEKELREAEKAWLRSRKEEDASNEASTSTVAPPAVPEEQPIISDVVVADMGDEPIVFDVNPQSLNDQIEETTTVPLADTSAISPVETDGHAIVDVPPSNTKVEPVRTPPQASSQSPKTAEHKAVSHNDYQNASTSFAQTVTPSATIAPSAPGTSKVQQATFSISTPTEPPTKRKRRSTKKAEIDKKAPVTNNASASGSSSAPVPSTSASAVPYPPGYPYAPGHAPYPYHSYYMPPYAGSSTGNTNADPRAPPSHPQAPMYSPYPYPYHYPAQQPYGGSPYVYPPYYTPYGAAPYTGRYPYPISPPVPVSVPKTAQRKSRKKTDASPSSTPTPAPDTRSPPTQDMPAQTSTSPTEPAKTETATSSTPSKPASKSPVPASSAGPTFEVQAQPSTPSTSLSATVPTSPAFTPSADRDIFRPSSYSSLIPIAPKPAGTPQYLVDTVAAISKNMSFNYYKPDVSPSLLSEKRPRRRRGENPTGELEQVNYMGVGPVESSQSQFSPTTDVPAAHVVVSPPTSVSPSQQSATNEPPQPAVDQSDPPPQPDSQAKPRPCGNKACRRVIPVDVLGNICEKCRLRMKKHQANAKQRFKLEPKKAILPRSGSRKSSVGVEATSQS
ncbi:hypothetical protein BDZ89DRAFT_1065672 [Hymenopellis radicata]|nr:hypothetical protein BDZ89DRAFT_1065672 [Hymenopellis radicata]